MKLDNDSLQERITGLESQLHDTQQSLDTSVLDLQTKVSFLCVSCHLLLSQVGIDWSTFLLTYVLTLTWPVDDIFVPPVIITSLCRDTISARTVVGHSLLLARLPGTHWVTICVIQLLALTVSDVYSRLVCFQSTSTSSALEVLHSMRYINLRFTYLLTYSLIDWWISGWMDGFIYLFIFICFVLHPRYSIPKGWNIKKRLEHVWNGHGADSEIGNVSARQASLNRWTATGIFIYLFIYLIDRLIN